MKQYIIVNTDLDMSKGKIGSQTAHASLGYAMDVATDLRVLFQNHHRWFFEHNQRKVVVGMSEEKMLNVITKLKEDGITYYAVNDVGSTEVPKGSLTAIAIEPRSEFPRYFARWRLL